MVEIRRLVVGPLATNTYIVVDGRRAVVVDPGDEAGRILREVEGLEVIAIVATHGHFDHVCAARRLVEALGAPLLMHGRDWEVIGDLVGLADAWGIRCDPPPQPRLIGEGDEVMGMRVMHVPGHTPGSIALLGDGFLISGDTLFRGAYGRTDLPHGDEGAIARSLCRIVGEVPHSYALLPGHGPGSTVGAEAGWVSELFGCSGK